MVRQINQHPVIVTAGPGNCPLRASTSPQRIGPAGAAGLRRLARRGFSLIEILVVISIIALITAIGVAAMSGMFSSANTNQTNVVLGQLASTLTEYKAETGGKVPTGDIDTFLNAINNQGGSAQKMLDSIDEELVDRNNQGEVTTVRDSWDTKIFYYDNQSGNEDFGEAKPKRPQPYFASAGADKKWGSINVNSNNFKPDGQAKDNLYSYEVQK